MSVQLMGIVNGSTNVDASDSSCSVSCNTIKFDIYCPIWGVLVFYKPL